ncbi:hypothetical protein TNCV_3467701 [Trichonephila clavipes]|nr:hypothetical protein TNCV_3467701 [Trichonephila clavipes]
MIIQQSVQHILTGYGMVARFASHLPSICTEGSLSLFALQSFLCSHLAAAARSVCVFVSVVSSIFASCMCNAVPTGSSCVSVDVNKKEFRFP